MNRTTWRCAGSTVILVALLASILVAVPATTAAAVNPDRDLSVRILAAPNFVVDSNVESPSSYGPEAAYLAAEVCNTGGDALTDVTVNFGDFDPNNDTDPADSTAGIYPSRVHTGLTGTFSLTHEGGAADATRYMGTLAAGECRTQYFLVSYPRLDDLGNSVTGGIKPDDDLWLEYDVWASAIDPVDGVLLADQTAVATMRNEISAMANKIWPNTDSKVPPEYLDAFVEQLGWSPSPSPDSAAGEVISLQGVWYDFGNVNKGFDNDGDLVPDYNAWMQPVGDPGLFDANCFRLVRTYGVVIVKLKGGGEEIIAFEDQLYFQNLPPNTGAVGLVFYEFASVGAGCSSTTTPYQEVASGADNEKFNGDYGTSPGTFTSSAPSATFDKIASATEVASGATVTYDLSLTNDSTTSSLGLTASGLPPVITETIPSGSTYVLDSAAAITQPTGTTTKILYFDASTGTWTRTQPATASDVTQIQWWLDADVPATETFATRFQVTATPAGGQTLITNTAGGALGGAEPFLEDTTTTFVTGTNTIGDTVFADDGGTTGTSGNGIQDGDEAGLDLITVTLYLDVDGDGTLDSGDVLRATTATSGGGSFSFPNLADGDYLVVVDDDDADIPAGWGPSTEPTLALTLAGASDLTADFGFAPVPVIDKALVGASPVAEGDQISYTIDLTNRLVRSDNDPCTPDCTLWAQALGSTASDFTNPSLALGVDGPDGTSAVADYGTGTSKGLWLTDFTSPVGLGTITAVDLVLHAGLTGTVLDNDSLVVEVYDTDPPGTLLSTTTLTGTQLNPLFNAPGEVSITLAGGWNWADFATNAPSVHIFTQKIAGPDSTVIELDAVGFRLSTFLSGTVFNPETTLSPIPLTDTYDPAVLDFVSASVTPTSVDESTGTITWADVGPLNASETTQIEVTFEVISSASASADYTTDNTASSTTATFADGSPASSATDVETVTVQPRGTIAGTIWSESSVGTNGWVGTTGVEAGIDFTIPGVTVQLYACVVTATGVPVAPGVLGTNACGDGGTGTSWTVYSTTTTGSDGTYLFEGLVNGLYYVDVDETTLPAGATATAEADAGPGAAGDQNNAGATCGTCDGIWGTPTATESSALFDPINTAGEDITGISFGYTTDPAVFGTLWEDVDGDGTRDTGEGPLVGWTVTADDGTTVYSTTTDADGNYVIDGLTAGVPYTISVTSPAGQTWTETFETDTTLDNSAFVTLAGGEINGSWDFAFTQSDASTIGDTIYWDWNGNGTQDASDEGVGGVTVDLYRDDNADGIADVFVATTTTAANGTYSFTLLPPGDYIVVVDESGPLLTAGASGDPDEVGQCVTCDGQSTVTVDGTASDLGQDFGYTPQGSASIGDTVYFDANGDTVQGATELGLSAITVELYADLNGDGTYVLVATTVTNGSGNYSFTGLPDGDYRVVVDSNDTDLPDDGVGNLAVPVSSDTVDVTLAGGVSIDTVDVGYATLGSIGDTVFADANGNGSQDWNESGWADITVELWEDTTNDGNYDTLVATTTTTLDGTYSFSSLPPGTYQARVDTTDPDLGGAAQTADPDRDGETCLDETFITLAAVPCDSADSGIIINYGTNYLGADFGYQPTGVVGDYLWFDFDGDGVQDIGEAGLADVTVTIFDGVDTFVTTTDPDGFYSFSGLADGAWTVSVTVPAGMTFISGADSVGTESGGTVTSAVVISGGVITSIDGTACTGCDLAVDMAFDLAGSSLLSGTVCYDTSAVPTGDCSVSTDGAQGVDVYIYQDTDANGVGDLLVGVTTTDANGDYSFPGLPDGDYSVAIATSVAPLDSAVLLTTTGDTPATSVVEYTSSVVQHVTLVGTATGIDFSFDPPNLDFGDLPLTYPTQLLAGAYHEITSLYLGTSIDSETDGQPSIDADADDLTAAADEDGVVFDASTWTVGTVGAGDGGSVDVTSSGSGYLVGYLDLNGDGDFTDAGELIISQAVTAGVTTIDFDLATVVRTGALHYARFRLFADAPQFESIAYQGSAVGGEVEDYALDLEFLPVTLTQFSSEKTRSSLEVEWTTATEVGNVGFNVLGEIDGHRVVLNDRIITNGVPDSLESQDYTFSTRATVSTLWLEDIDIEGHTLLHGPFEVGTTWAPATGPSEEPDWASIGDERYAEQGRTDAVKSRKSARKHYRKTTGAVADFLVEETSRYLVTYEDLKAKGIDLRGIRTEVLSITVDDQPIPVRVQGPKNRFGPGATIEFDGEAISTLYTDTNVYRLQLDKVLAGRAPRELATPDQDPRTTVEVNVDQNYSLTTPSDDPWYDAAFISFGPARGIERIINLPELRAGTEPETLSVEVWGVTSDGNVNPDHHVEISLNGTSVADEYFDGANVHQLEIDLPPGVAVAGENVLTVNAVADTGARFDYQALNRFSISYTGSDPGEPSPPSVPEIRVVGSTPQLIEAPVDYLMISHPDFIASLALLTKFHRSRGLSVKVVDVNDIYSQYSGGIVDAQAIDDYIADAHRVAGMSYVLLVGGDTIDYHDVLGLGSISFVPSLYGSTGGGIHHAPIDPAYADTDDDGVPDLALGRFPVRTNAELETLIAKTLTYVTSARDYGDTMIVAADATSTRDFGPAADDALEPLTDDWTIERAYIGTDGTAAAGSVVVDAIDGGVAWTSYIGHSGPSSWSSSQLFTTQDAAALANAGRPTVIAQYGCWNTYHVDPRQTALVHELLTQDVGAAAVFGATTLTTARSDLLLARAMSAALAGDSTTIGEVLMTAKTSLAADHTGLADVQLGWTLEGDPALPVN